MYATITCPECHTTTTADMGELGPELDAEPCRGSDTCTKLLCPCCPQVVCYCCGKPSCPEHIEYIEDDPERFCVRIDVDLDDASLCPLHGPAKNWKAEPWCEVCRKAEAQEAQKDERGAA